MNRGYNREVVFATDDDRAHFLGLLERYRERFAVRLYHYCLLSNHFHLLVRCEEARERSAWMAGLLRSYVPYYHRRTGFVGHRWQGRFKSPSVAAEAYFLSCARYIERNPVEAGLVCRPWEYCWSSSPAYALSQADPLLVYNVWYQELAPMPPGVSAAGRISCWETIRTRRWYGAAIGSWAATLTDGSWSAPRRGRSAG